MTTISLLVPTLDRAEFLEWSLRTTLEIDDDHLQIVVSDNCSQDDTSDVVDALKDPRVEYVRTDARVAMRANFQNALNAATGDYVCIIGDDDAMLPRQYPILRKLLETEQPDCLYWDLPVYFWPSDNRKTGEVKLRRRMAFGQPTKVDCKAYRSDLVNANVHLSNWGPAIYHGVVSRRFFERILQPDGTLFAGTIPDIFFSYRALIEGGTFLRCEHPFTFAGMGKSSNGAAQLKKDDSKIALEFMADNASDLYADVLPQLRSVPWALFSAFETVRDRIGDTRHLPNYEAWYRYLLCDEAASDASHRTRLLEHMESHAARTGSQQALRIAQERPSQGRKSLLNVVRRELNNFERVKAPSARNGNDTIYSASRILDDLLADDYANVLSGDLGRRGAWRRLRQRCAALDG